MPYPPILRDAHGNPIPVVWDGTINNWRVLKGFEHGQQMRLLDKDGNPITSDNPLPVTGEVTLTLTGHIMEFAVLSWDEIAPDAVPVGSVAILIGTNDIRQTDGKEWLPI